MSKGIPQIQKYMTTGPHSIAPDLFLSDAQHIMWNNRIRHLPVVEDGKLVGLLSDRDIKLIESLKDVDPSTVLVSDAMSEDVFTVSPTSMLDDVSREMASHKYGSAVVMQNGKVVGMFTTTDALQALADLLHTRLA